MTFSLFDVFLKRQLYGYLIVISVHCALGLPSLAAADLAGKEWKYWGGDAGANHYSTLDQINTENVATLSIAWIHDSGDHADGSGTTRATTMQVTPLVTNGFLYYCTPFQRVFALDPETGLELWRYDPKLVEKKGDGPYPLNCRGLSYWEDSELRSGGLCSKRIFYATSDSHLIALDAETGKPCTDFGRAGRVALRDDLDEERAWLYYPTSPPQVMRDHVIVNGFVADNLDVNSAPGVVRAFDARTGALRWAWDTAPPDWTAGKDSARNSQWVSGTPNSWSIITGDHQRGLVFVPTGNRGGP